MHKSIIWQKYKEWIQTTKTTEVKLLYMCVKVTDHAVIQRILKVILQSGIHVRASSGGGGLSQTSGSLLSYVQTMAHNPPTWLQKTFSTGVLLKPKNISNSGSQIFKVIFHNYCFNTKHCNAFSGQKVYQFHMAITYKPSIPNGWASLHNQPNPRRHLTSTDFLS